MPADWGRAALPMKASTRRCPCLGAGPGTTAAPPYASVSRSYWQQVDGTQLQRGLDLPLTAPDAVIQLSPAAGARALPANTLQVRDPAGRSSVAAVDARARCRMHAGE